MHSETETVSLPTGKWPATSGHGLQGIVNMCSSSVVKCGVSLVNMQIINIF